MLLTVDNTSRIGKPVRILDAAGEEVTHVVECDTTTGHVVRLMTSFGIYVRTPDGTDIERFTETRAAPLRAEPVPNFEDFDTTEI